LWHSEARRWLKRLGLVALATVVVQGLLGGITVLYFLPTAVSTAHAALAQVFFCLTVAIALFTSRAWIGAEHPPDDGRLRWLATAATAIIYVQILVGAAMRHTGAGLAIPDFPLMFGGIVPDRWSAPIAVHFAHRAGALLVIGAVSATALYVRARHSGHRKLRGPATVILGLVAVQIALGASTVLTERNVWVNSSHVVVGALTLATSLVITLRSWRVKFGLSGVGRDWTAAVARGADAADAARSAAGAERGRVDRTRARA
jgi:cytochrome c oxidase assembly protein subunit 15